MAIVTRQLAAVDDASAEITFSYDDVSNVIQSITLRNDDPGIVTGLLRDRLTNVVVFGPESRPVRSGVVTRNLIPLNLLMAGTPLEPPFLLTISWTAR